MSRRIVAARPAARFRTHRNPCPKSPRARTPAPARAPHRLTSIDDWFAKHYNAGDVEPWTDPPTFESMRDAARERAREIDALMRALDDPFAAGAADLIGKAYTVFGADEDWTCTLSLMGDALKWGLAGADVSELERRREQAREQAAESDEVGAEARRALEQDAKDSASIIDDFREAAHVCGEVAALIEVVDRYLDNEGSACAIDSPEGRATHALQLARRQLLATQDRAFDRAESLKRAARATGRSPDQRRGVG
jgi:hypothetical protein